MRNIGIQIFPKRFRYSRSIVYVNANYRSFIFIITSVIPPSIAKRVSNDTETMVHIYADCWDANQFFLPTLNSFPNICNSDIMNLIAAQTEHAKHTLSYNSLVKKRLHKRRAFSSVASFDKRYEEDRESIHQYVVIIGCFVVQN